MLSYKVTLYEYSGSKFPLNRFFNLNIKVKGDIFSKMIGSLLKARLSFIIRKEVKE